MNQNQQLGENVTADMAWSVLFESMAGVFSYPQPVFYDAIANGQLLRLIRECLHIIEPGHSLTGLVDSLNDTLPALCQQNAFDTLEPDYIALFEVNRNEPPLHPNAHLYEPKSVDQLSLNQQLNRIYRDNGLEINSGQQADHLSVQLNFMAWLHRQADSSGDIDRYHGVIRNFHPKLLWVARFAQQLEARQHWLYSPMSRLLASLIELSCKTI